MEYVTVFRVQRPGNVIVMALGHHVVNSLHSPLVKYFSVPRIHAVTGGYLPVNTRALVGERRDASRWYSTCGTGHGISPRISSEHSGLDAFVDATATTTTLVGSIGGLHTSTQSRFLLRFVPVTVTLPPSPFPLPPLDGQVVTTARRSEARANRTEGHARRMSADPPRRPDEPIQPSINKTNPPIVRTMPPRNEWNRSGGVQGQTSNHNDHTETGGKGAEEVRDCHARQARGRKGQASGKTSRRSSTMLWTHHFFAHGRQPTRSG